MRRSVLEALNLEPELREGPGSGSGSGSGSDADFRSSAGLVSDLKLESEGRNEVGMFHQRGEHKSGSLNSDESDSWHDDVEAHVERQMQFLRRRFKVATIAGERGWDLVGRQLLTLFRSGALGKLTLDEVPVVDGGGV